MPDDDTDAPASDTKPDLGDAGKKALDAERRARREADARVKELEARLGAIEDKDKTEVERLTAKVTTAEKERDEAVAKALRFEVAADKGVKPRWLSGLTREELEAAADEYLADHPPAGSPSGGAPAPAKPAENLRGGGEPDQEPEPDIRKVVESISRGF